MLLRIVFHPAQQGFILYFFFFYSVRHIISTLYVYIFYYVINTYIFRRYLYYCYYTLLSATATGRRQTRCALGFDPPASQPPPCSSQHRARRPFVSASLSPTPPTGAVTRSPSSSRAPRARQLTSSPPPPPPLPPSARDVWTWRHSQTDQYTTPGSDYNIIYLSVRAYIQSVHEWRSVVYTNYTAIMSLDDDISLTINCNCIYWPIAPFQCDLLIMIFKNVD